MNTKVHVLPWLIVTILLPGGCARSVQERSPQKLFDEFAATLAGFNEGLNTDERLLSEDVIAGLGEVSGGLNQLNELCANSPELQPTLKSMQQTLDEMKNQIQSNIDKAQLRKGIAKLQEQSATLHQLMGKR